MPRLLYTLLAPLLCSLLPPATGFAAQTVLQRPMDLDTGTGMLHGTLLLPGGEGPAPVALLVAGSGPTDRNGNNPMGGRNDSLKKLAELLARNGIASLRFDKRGIAASHDAGPDERQLSLDGYVDDAVAWARQLRADPRFSRLILIGHSEGALIASLAAPRTEAAALVVIAGSGRPFDQLLVEQLRQRLPPPLLARSAAILAALGNGQTVDEVPPPLMVLFRPSVQPYLISLLAHDPVEAFAAVKVPALILQGSHDIQVGVADAEALKAVKPDAELAVIGGMNHILRITPAGIQEQLGSYNAAELPLARELGQHLLAFIAALPSSPPPGGR